METQERKQALESLKKNSFRIPLSTSTIILRNVKTKKAEEALVSKSKEIKEHTFSIKGNVLAFCTDNALYCIPYINASYQILISNAFELRDYSIPFDETHYPDDDFSHWSILVENARVERETEFIKNCLDYSQKKGLKEINPMFIYKCFILPSTGVKIEYQLKYYLYLPSIKETDTEINYEKIGQYSEKHGVYSFVYCNGLTYVTKDKSVIDELEKAGFKKTININVPFYHEGEFIVDKKYQAEWDRLTESLK